jgi:3-phenylpropionate/cinnamic acid dioxygenase small subunit
MSSETAIRNLLYRYAELIDSGDLPGAARLFAHARIRRRERAEPMTAAELLGFWQARIILYPCGTPRTKHVVTNAIVEIDDVAGTATSRSYYTVLQATEGFPLQMIAQGRYHDWFERADGGSPYATIRCWTCGATCHVI